MNRSPYGSAGTFGFADAERAQLESWVGLSTRAKIDFFEEMIEIAYQSGALAPDRLAMRDGLPQDAV